MNFILLNILCISVNLVSSFEGTSLCVGKNATSQPVIEYCANQTGEMLYRCCRKYDNKTFIAIDLTEANLTEIPNFAEHLHFNFTVIDLRLNDDIVSSNVSAFIGLSDLDYLLLPDHIECPGGNGSWEIIDETTDPPGTLCQHQISICSSSPDLCTERGALCTGNGPTKFLCFCKPGYHGYKCLRYGNFPSGAFYGTTAGITVIASALLYWKQRRNVINR
jgi:hypothetical protein